MFASGKAAAVASAANYIEDVFSNYLYTGTGATVTQTISNGIDESGKGALTWFKKRSTTSSHLLFDTNRGTDSPLATNSTSGQGSGWSSYFNFLSNGVSVSDDLNVSGTTYTSWTFRKQPKFYTQGTYTGNGTGTSIGSGVLQRDIAHDLGSTPGCVIIKNLDTGNWVVYHRSSAFGTENLRLNTTGAGFNASGYAPIYAVSSTTFSVIVGATGLSSNDNCNINGASYVYYIFAHNAGGFGLTGTDNVISCGSGSWSGGSDNVVNLGYEVQWLMYKSTDIAGSNWMMWDTMRGMSYSASEFLRANLSAAAGTYNSPYAIYPTATGFTVPAGLVSTGNYIYIAIRRGPMKVPTDATKVYGQQLNVALPTFAFPPDMVLELSRASDPTYGQWVSDRLRGSNQILQTFSTNAETSGSPFAAFNQGGKQTTWGDGWSGGYIVNGFQRAPSFFDEVCYTGDGVVGRTVNHNLQVAPELMIIKRRDAAGYLWRVYSGPLGPTQALELNTNVATVTDLYWNNTAPTASVFSLYSYGQVNASGGTYVAYLFATCPGVSKVTSFTGNGSTQTINCGFTSGARFVLIKATSTTGNWLTFDTARGMTTSTDPWLALNSTAAESATTGACTTTSVGFTVDESKLTGVNTNGVSYIALAIA